MMKPSLADLTAFTAVARHRSFRRAADALALSRSSLSHAVGGLERDLGVRLLHRTTRSVSLTDAGAQLLAGLEPLLRNLDALIGEATGGQDRVGGPLRINCSEAAADRLLEAAIPAFLDRFPQVTLDLITDGRLIDIVAAGFDAGIRLAEAVPQEMHAVSFGGDIRFLPVAAPSYLASRKTPKVPNDLLHHTCIRQRLPSGKAYRWEFAKQGQEITLDAPGLLTLDNNRLMVKAAVDGLGIAFVPEPAARACLRDGSLLPLLEDWCPSVAGLCLYYPGHRHVPRALRAFIDVLKQTSW